MPILKCKMCGGNLEVIEKLILDEYDRYMKLTRFYERLNVKVS